MHVHVFFCSLLLWFYTYVVHEHLPVIPSSIIRTYELLLTRCLSFSFILLL